MQNVQNDVFYLREAFKKLSTLNEDSFDLTSDVGVVDELQSFVADDIKAPYEEEIIDIDADTKDDLLDSYVGKVILQCNCCNTKIYKDPLDVVIDEETETANIDEECPKCGNFFGWAVIGKIEPFDENEDFSEEDVNDNVESEEEITDKEITEALKESLNEDINIDVNTNEVGEVEDVIIEKEPTDVVVVEDESVENNLPADDIDFFDEGCNKKVNEEVEIHVDTDAEGNVVAKVETDEHENVEVVDAEPVEQAEVELVESFARYADTDAQEEILGLIERCAKKADVGVRVGTKVGKYPQTVILDHNYQDGMITVHSNGAFEIGAEEFGSWRDGDYSAEDFDELEVIDALRLLDDDTDESLKEELIQHEEAEEVAINPDSSVEHDQKLEDPEEDPVMDERNEVSLQEDIENLSLDTEATHMEMTSDDNGKVVVVTEPREEVGEGEEMIAPLTKEDEVEIELNEPEVPEDEFEIDEFDEKTFDELGEGFLKRVYENVNCFKTTNVKYENKNLIIEGLIGFKSGKEKATTFKFENFKETRRGKVLIGGLNEMFSKNKKSFILKGSLSNKHFISESLVYKYNTKDINESNKSSIINVYGKVVVKK